MAWKFTDPPNSAVIINKKIISSGGWIAYVSHDIEDGGWQFHNGGELNESDAMVVSLRNIVDLDSSVTELFDLPVGWSAWRKSRFSPWQRQKDSAAS